MGAGAFGAVTGRPTHRREGKGRRPRSGLDASRSPCPRRTLKKPGTAPYGEPALGRTTL